MITRFLVLLILFVVEFQQCYSFKKLFVSKHYISSLVLDEKNDDSESDKSPNKNNNKAKSSKFNRLLDDFMGKKFGAGEAFYGKRSSSLSEAEYSEIRNANKKPVKTDDEILNDMKDNAIMLVGDPSVDMIQWIAYELHERGFRVRICSQSKKTAVEVFGSPGFNVDIIDLQKSSPEKRFSRAIQGVQAVIFCDNFNPTLDSYLDNNKNSLEIAEKLLDISTRAQLAGVGTIQKIVVLSRYLPWIGSYDSINDENESGNVLSKLQGALDYFLQYIPFSGSSNSNSKVLFSNFHKVHKQLEDLVIKSGFEFVIVRSPSIVEKYRVGAVDKLRIKNVITFENDSKQANLQQQQQQNRNKKNNSEDKSLIGELDLAEATTQALLTEQMTNVIFSVETTSTSPFIDNKNNDIDMVNDSQSNNSLFLKQRPRRDFYYAILGMDDDNDTEAMKRSYIMRTADSYRQQLLEDENVDNYWLDLFLLFK